MAREDMARREDQRRELCVELASAADEAHSRMWTFVDYRLADRDGWREDPYVQGLYDTLRAADVRFERAYNELRILGMGSFGAEADQIRNAFVDAMNLALDEAQDKYPEHFGEEIAEFLDAAGDEFGTGATETTPPRPKRSIREKPKSA